MNKFKWELYPFGRKSNIRFFFQWNTFTNTHTRTCVSTGEEKQRKKEKKNERAREKEKKSRTSCFNSSVKGEQTIKIYTAWNMKEALCHSDVWCRSFSLCTEKNGYAFFFLTGFESLLLLFLFLSHSVVVWVAFFTLLRFLGCLHIKNKNIFINRKLLGEY